MNRFYQGDWIDSMASRFIEELPEKHLEKNSFFEDDANEVVQNTYIKIYKKIKLYKVTSKFSVWIYRIDYNETMTQMKAKKGWVFGFFDHESNEETAPQKC